MPHSSLILYYGTDDFLKKDAAHKIIEARIPEAERDFALDVIDSACDTIDECKSAVKQIIEACYTTSFFGNGKVIWAKDISFLTGGKSRASDAQDTKNAVEKLLTTLKETPLPEGHTLLFTVQGILKTSRFFAYINKEGETKELGGVVKPWEEAKVAKERVEALLLESGLTMPAPVVTAFAQRVGLEARSIVSELEKLRSYKGKETTVTLQDVEEITSRAVGAEPFAIRDAIIQRDPVAIVKAVNLLRTVKGSDFMTANAIIATVSELLFLREALAKDWITPSGWTPHAPMSMIPSKLASQRGFMLTKNVNAAKKFSLNELRAARHYAICIREQLVSSTLQDPWNMIELYLLRIIARPIIRKR